MTLIDFTLSNARQFYLSMENPLTVKGLNCLFLISVILLHCCCRFLSSLILVTLIIIIFLHATGRKRHFTVTYLDFFTAPAATCVVSVGLFIPAWFLCLNEESC